MSCTRGGFVVQTSLGGNAPRNQVTDAIAVGKDVLTNSNVLTSKLHLLAAFDQFLGDDEVMEAAMTYQNCGACMIETGSIQASNVLWSLILSTLQPSY
jgi:hypothetical protein